MRRHTRSPNGGSMKYHRILGVFALAGLFVTSTARAQNPGTFELGAFGQYTIFDDELFMDNAFGGGARLGLFIVKWLSIEGDISIQKTGTQRAGEDITYRPWSFGGLIHIPLGEKARLHLGGGYTQSVYEGRFSANEFEDAIHATAGLRFCTGQKWGLRFDVVPVYNPSPNEQALTSLNWHARVGLSYYTGAGCIGEKFDWSMALSPASVTLRRGASQNLSITGTDMKGRSVLASRFRNLTCTSSDPAVATVDNTGRVTAVRAGTATITCSTMANGILRTATSSVTVPFPTWTMSVSPATATRDTGQTVQLAVTARDEDNVDVSAGSTWSSSNPSVATVSSTGLVRCVGGGTATITASKTQYGETKTATATITCNQPPPPPPPADRMIISLDTIFFAFDRYDIQPAGRETLNRVIQLLTDSASWRISIEGHTDNYGSDEYNQRLSERRANSVLNYLTRRPGRIAASRVQWKGYSERCLIVPEGDKQQQAINRRVEIWQLVVLNAPPENCRPARQD